MKSLIVSSNCSGGGKTTVTLGIMKALSERGFKVQGYKVGPDYIDSAFHSKITGVPSRNLDIFLSGEEGVKRCYSNGNGDLGVVEGVMGLYDGKGLDSEFSTHHVSKVLELPVILVLSPKAQVATLCAEIKGLIEFDNAKVKGIILNNVSEKFYTLLKLAIEKNCNVPVLGYVPKDEKLALKSRHLGLVQSSEIDDLEDKINHCSNLIEKHVDVDKLIELFEEGIKTEKEDKVEKIVKENGEPFKVGIAMDEAFSFYYRENIELLEALGKVVYFSPLKDEVLPNGLDFIYIGGGYPEVFKEELEKNKSMRESINKALSQGTTCYAECGGLMYLTEEIEGSKMVGFFKGSSYMTKTLNNFGYATLETPMGLKINCHEFHKSKVDICGKPVYNVEKNGYKGDKISWACGYLQKNTLAGYPHVHFYGNKEFLYRIIKGGFENGI